MLLKGQFVVSSCFSSLTKKQILAQSHQVQQTEEDRSQTTGREKPVQGVDGKSERVTEAEGWRAMMGFYLFTYFTRKLYYRNEECNIFYVIKTC